jgi:hypothetical protein
MEFAEGSREAVLNEIVSGNEVAGQRPRIASQAGNFAFDVLIKVGHSGLLPMAAIGQWVDQNIGESSEGMLSDDVRPNGFV